MVTRPLAVVVGLDPSPSAQAALQFGVGVGVAQRRRPPLRLVCTFEGTQHAVHPSPGSPLDAPLSEIAIEFAFQMAA
jgi:hypothetical protein